MKRRLVRHNHLYFPPVRAYKNYQLDWSIQECDATAFEAYQSVYCKTYPLRDETPPDLAMELSKDLPRLRMDALNIDICGEDFPGRAIRIIEDAQALDRKLSTWVQDLPEEYTVTMQLNEKDSDEGAPEWTYKYSCTSIAMRWINWRLNRLRVLYIIKHFASLLESQISAPAMRDLEAYTAPIPHIIEDIYSSVPFEQADFLANGHFDAIIRDSPFIQACRHDVENVLSTFFILHMLEIGRPIGPIKGVEFAEGRHVPWGREYIELYAWYPCASLN